MSNKKKLLVTGSTFPRWEKDTEPRFILDYAKAMTEYFEVHVLVPMAPGAKEEENMEGVIVHRFHYFPIHKFETLCYPGAIVPRIKEKKIRTFLVPFLLVAMRIAAKKYTKQVDIVHAHWLIPQGIVQSTIKGKPYIVTGHGGDVASLNFSIIKKLKKNCIDRAMAVTGVSSFICEKIKEISPECDPEMIPMGCNLNKFTPILRNEYYFNHDKKNILYVGRLAEKKGVKYLIEAMKSVDARLFIVGTGPLEEELKRQAEYLEADIIFLGAKSHEELPEIMASADLFVAPSIIAKDGDQEGLPVSIMEAMASGLPVISGISGGTRDIMVDGKNGYILDAQNVSLLANRINEILTDDKLFKAMSAAAIDTSETFGYEHIGKRYYELINNIVYINKY